MPATPEALAIALADKYRLEREIGAGGMATVYVAQDLKHDRRVAVKVLRPELAAVIGAERFLAEIKTTAHLQNPHILPLFDSGAADGFLYYVMPYVEGESLRHRLDREKQLPIAEAVRIATEVAGALDHAHRHKVIHRDIKPENILLHDGAALVADFGIALAVTSSSSTRMTETGMSLGTPHYMSPEQAMGEREIGPQSDIYALGAVTYEMLVGEPPFTGPTAQAIVAKVVTEDPRPLIPKRHTIPPHIDAAVLTAIQKLPADRFATAAEFASALANRSYTSTGMTNTVARPLTRREIARRSVLPFAAGALLVAAAAAGWTGMKTAAEEPVTRFALELPAAQQPLVTRAFAISPDGRYLAYPGPGPDGSQIWLKSRDRFDAHPLAGTIGGGGPVFSPDGDWIAFAQGAQLKKISVLGGSSTTLADSMSLSVGAAWLDDNSIVYMVNGNREVRRVAATGGPFTTVWKSTTLLAYHLSPLPGSRDILFVQCTSTGCVTGQDLWTMNLGTGEGRELQKGVASGIYLRTGHILYVRRDGGAFAVRFDPKKLELRGSPIAVLDSVAVVSGNVPLLDVSAEGTLVLRSGTGFSTQPLHEMVWFDQDGKVTPIDTSWQFRNTAAGDNAGWRLSRDGKRLVIGLATSTGDDIWVKQMPRGALSRLTLESGPEIRPRWTPDGQSVLYGDFVNGSVMRRRADGTGTAQTLLDRPEAIFEFQYTPDSAWLVYRTGGTVAQIGARDIFAVRVGGDTTPVPIVADPKFDEAGVDVSPDGKWIVYESNETGRKEVYVRPFPNADAGKWQISTAGGTSPLWAKNGREIYFIERRQMRAATVTTTPTFDVGTTRTLFAIPADVYSAETDNYAPFDVAADGRFIMARRLQTVAAPNVPLLFVLNWFEELKAKMKGR